MKTNISEDLPARKFSPAAAGGGSESGSSGAAGPGGDIEKKARQLVYDAKYEVRKMMGKDTRMDPAAVTRAVLQRIDKSSSSQPIKMRARKIVMGDTQKRDVKEFASQNVAKALFDVFVNHSTNIIDEEELKKDLEEAIETQGEKKYKVRVTDKKTGNSYIRWATRPKITELRGNPNIESVEMLDLYGSPEPNQSERSKGAQTASVTAGKGMNNDGNLANNYPPYNKVTRGDVIAGATGKDQMGGKKKVKEEFIGEGDNDRNDKQIKPMKGKNKCKVYDGKGGGNMMMGQGLMMHQELEGEVIAETGYSRFLKKVNSILEMAVSQNQQQLAAMAIEYIDGNMPDASEDVKKMAKMGKEELKKFASTSHEGLPEKVKEENESGCGDGEKKKEKEMDPREIPTRVNLVKNKLRAMGLKMSYEPEGEKIDEFFGPFAKPKTVLPKTTQLSGSIKSVTPGKKYPATLGGKSADVTYDKSGGRSVTPSATSPTSPKPAPKQPGVGERARQGLEASKKRLEMSYDPEGEVIDERTIFAKKKNVSATTGRPSVEGGNPEIAKRNKPPLKYGGSKQPRKDRGGKTPSPSEQAIEQGVLSPLQHKAALLRASRKRAAEFKMDTRGT